MESGTRYFVESQRFYHNRWAVLPALVALGLCGASVSTAMSEGFAGPPLFIAGVLALVASVLFFGELRTEVRDDGLHAHLFPLTRRHHFPFAEIASCEARTYRPIREYGGWGVRWGRSGKAYNVYGNRGIQLQLADGQRLLIGSQEPETLAAIINARRGRG